PQNASRGSEGQPHSVPQPRCEQLLARAVRVVANDGRSAPVLLAADVARGTHGDVEPAVGSERDRSRRVVAAAWQARNDDGAPGRLACGRIILKPQHPAHLGDVEIAVLPGQSMWEVEALDDRDRVGRPASRVLRKGYDAPFPRSRYEENA